MKWAFLAVAVSACTTQGQMDAAPVQKTAIFSENYQLVYDRLNKGIRHCYSTPVTVDAQLYSELGYGEITLLAHGHPMQSVRITKADGGSKLEMRSLAPSQSVRAGSGNWMEYWAHGGSSCPGWVSGVSVPPPEL